MAPWHFRAGAFAVDVLPAAAVVATMALVSFTVPARSAWWWVCICVVGVAILLVLVNRLLLPAVTGGAWDAHCLESRWYGAMGKPPGRGGCCSGTWPTCSTPHRLVGWLWPLWDSRRRTFADMLLRTEVRRVEPDERPRDIRRWTAVAVLTAAGLCLAGADVSYGVVYARDRATDQTRAQIATQGPKIVAQMLTYDPKSLRDDFARALSLATDKYRGQLAAQQDAVKKGQPGHQRVLGDRQLHPVGDAGSGDDAVVHAGSARRSAR